MQGLKAADLEEQVRLCIDNILMTEPVRAGYEITGVTLLPAQPLMTDQVGVQATIGRFLENPLGIQLYLSYYQGTNIWGYANWRGRDTNVLNTWCYHPHGSDRQQHVQHAARQ